MKENNMNSRILNILEWPVIEKKISDLCHFQGARDYISTLTPLGFQEAEVQISKITSLKELIQRGDRADFSGLFSIDREVSLARRGGMLSIPELAKIKKFTAATERIRKYIKKYTEEYPALKEEHDRFREMPVLKNLLGNSITDDEELNSAEFPILGRLKKKINDLRRDIEKRIHKIIHSQHNEKIIQEKTFTTVSGRYVILIKSGTKGRISGSVLDMSASGQTLYLEPSEIAPLSNEMILLERELDIEIQKILTELTIAVAAHSDIIEQNIESVSYFDFIYSSADFSILTNSTEQKLSKEPVIKLKKAHHPLLYMMSPDKVVSNDIILGEDYSCLIISGANTGGKTVTLKTLGLCTLLTMYGLHIPAGPDSEIGIFDNIMADIGDDQNLSQSLSTFSGQITFIDDMLKKADERTLVIIDEIIVGTNPRQGAALSQAILENMIECGCKIVVTTHYTELKELPVRDSRFENASVRFDMESLQPTYELVIGVPGISYALEIAKNYGISENILSRAKELVDSRESSVEALLEKVQEYEEKVKKEKGKVAFLKNEIYREKDRLKKKQNELRLATEMAKKNEGITFIDEINSYRKKISEQITSLQNLDQKKLSDLNLQLKDMKEKVSSELKGDSIKNLTFSMKPVNPDTLKEGDTVYVSPIETEGIIDSIDAGKKTAQVILGGSIRSRYNIKDLMVNPDSKKAELPSGRNKSVTRQHLEEGESTIPSTMQTSYNTIDLRGRRVDEALNLLDSELDRMERDNIRYVVIIHGHGTGALKQAVRDTLKMSIYIRRFRNGDYGEGGDGVTIAELR